MSLLERGLSAFQLQQYTEALHYFQQALPGERSASERERVRMWIARCSLAVGREELLLTHCSQLLSSTDAQVRAFARAGLKLYGLAHPGPVGRIEPHLGGILTAAGRVYLDRFWQLVPGSLVAGVWVIALSCLAVGWGALTLGVSFRGMVDTPLHAALAVWGWLLALVPAGACALVAFDRLLAILVRQRHIVLGAAGTCAEPAKAPKTAAVWRLRLGCLAITSAAVAILVLIAQAHWWAAGVAALTLQPWLLSLWLVLELVVSADA
ncbi:MAG: hypothetical protein KME03_03690 [Aphanocapsa lilacina HA4352-LM1]|jgi:hypothetical protein|nr:hypothetical protein [Aphanocapsa lilacina HA4352-LM1]